MDHEIIKLAPADLLLAKELINLWQEEDGILNPHLPGDNYLIDLLSSDSFHVFVAVKDKLVIGGLTAYELKMFPKEETEMFLYEIGVHEGHRQIGIARQLIEMLKTLCTEKGIDIIFVGTSGSNEPAKKLYKVTGGEMEDIPWFTYDLSHK